MGRALKLGRNALIPFCAVTLGTGGAWGDGIEVRQVEAAPYNWTGLYAGAHMGGALSLSDTSDPLGATLFGNPIHAPGPIAGGQVGYNYQSGQTVLGLEADASFSEMEGTGTCSSLSANFINSNCVVDVDAFGTLAGRLGLALGPEDRALIYGKAGLAWMTGSVAASTNDGNAGFAGNPFTRRTTDLTQWGWMLGAGAEYAVAPAWSVKAEYEYVSLGSEGMTLPPTVTMDATGAITSAVPQRTGRIDTGLQTLKVGLNYHFGAPAAAAFVEAPAPAGPRGFNFEIGGRYWYSWGKHQYDLGLLKGEPAPPHSLISRLTYDNLQTNSGELYARLDASYQVFVKGFVGTGTTGEGKMSDEDFNIGTPPDQLQYTRTRHWVEGELPAYAAVDLGYDWWRAAPYRIGTYVGYSYFHEAMDAWGCAQTINPIGPCSGTPAEPTAPATGHPIITQTAVWQAVRLGGGGDIYLLPRFKLSGDAAYLPFVHVSAQDDHFLGNTPNVASINKLRGYGTGVQLEAMLSYDVTERLSLGIGGRYWGMWTRDGSMVRPFNSQAPVPAIPPHQNLRMESERAGLLGQVLYKFD